MKLEMEFLDELNNSNVPKTTFYKSLYDFPLGVPLKVVELKWASTHKGECVRLDVEDNLECFWYMFYEGKKSLHPEEKNCLSYDDDDPVFGVVYEMEPRGTRSVFFKPYGE